MSGNHQQTWEEAVADLKSRPDAQALVKACFYDDPLVAAADRYWRSSEWAAVRHLLPASVGTALDVGAGRGISSYALARDGWRVTALEPDPSPLVGAGAIRRLADEACLDIDVVQEWGEELPFSDASFDLVHCRQVLHHARDLKALCRQISRVLKPGGMLIATREHVLSSKRDLPAFLASHPLHAAYGGENAYLLKEYIGALTAAGIPPQLVLNPLESDINAFPETLKGIRARWANRLYLPSARLFPMAALSVWGALSNTPGRLYSFASRKPEKGTGS